MLARQPLHGLARFHDLVPPAALEREGEGAEFEPAGLVDIGVAKVKLGPAALCFRDFWEREGGLGHPVT